jgi:hypothetical protein
LASALLALPLIIYPELRVSAGPFVAGLLFYGRYLVMVAATAEN